MISTLCLTSTSYFPKKTDCNLGSKCHRQQERGICYWATGTSPSEAHQEQRIGSAGCYAERQGWHHQRAPVSSVEACPFLLCHRWMPRAKESRSAQNSNSAICVPSDAR